MLNALFTVLAILELALLHQCLPGPAQLAFPLFTAPSSISFLRRLAPRFSNSIRKRNSYVNQNSYNNSSKYDFKKKFFNNNFKKPNIIKQSHPFYEFYLHQSQLSQNGFIHKVLPVLESSTLEIINSPYLNNQFHNLINSQKATHSNQNNHPHLLIHHPIQNLYTSSAFHHPKYYHPHFSSSFQPPANGFSKTSLQLINKLSKPSVNLPLVNQSPFTFSSSFNQLTNYHQQNQQDINPQLIENNKNILLLSNINSKLKNLEKNEPLKKSNDDYSTTVNPLIESSSHQLDIVKTAPLNQFKIETVNVENFNLDDNNLENIKKIKNENFTLDFFTPTMNSLLKNDANQLFKQLTSNQLQHYNNHGKNRSSDFNSKYSYNLIGDFNSTKYDFNQNIQVDFKERTAPDTSAGIFSRALGTLSTYLPNAMKITRTSGCVGGTKCQFFLSCWISSGSLGSSCGPLSTCCITPSKQDIQPAFYGPVINDPHCGRSATRISRIVGGTDASFGQFPWQAFVQVGGSRCGGALVGKKHVVTAGHCVARSQHNPSEIRVTLGDYILNSDIESLPHELFTVAEVRLHPNFRFTPQADRYDVAILILDRVVQYRNNIKPICLPQKDTNYLGRVAYVAGWGALQAGSKLRPKVLQHVNVPVIDNNVCEIWHRKRGINIKIHDEMVCAGFEGGSKDACQGDSGGPLMLNEYGVWYLIGIVSAGYSCAKQYQPGIYHRVSSSSDWVSANVYQNSN